MPIARFEAEPQAEATAIMLREQGYDADVLVRSADEDAFDRRAKAFFSGNQPPFAIHAIVVSDAAAEPFARAVLHHYGLVVDAGAEELR